VSRLFDRERGARSAALTLAGPRLCSGYPGHAIPESCITDLEPNLTDPIRVRICGSIFMRSWLLLNRRRMGDVSCALESSLAPGSTGKHSRCWELHL